MFHEMTIAGLKRQLPLCKVTDGLYIGAFIMFGDVEITVASARELLKKNGIELEFNGLSFMLIQDSPCYL